MSNSGLVYCVNCTLGSEGATGTNDVNLLLSDSIAASNLSSSLVEEDLFVVGGENVSRILGERSIMSGTESSLTSPLQFLSSLISQSSSASSSTDTSSSVYNASTVNSAAVGAGMVGGGVVGNPALSLSTWILVIVLTVLIIVTIIGNVLVCLSVILVRKLRKPQNYLLVSLATSDLFVALFVMPFAIVFEVNGAHWPLNDGLCDLWVSADVLCCTASILNLCGISVDRYRAITIPLEYSAKTTPKRMLAVIFVVWLGSACVSLPPVLLLGNVHMDVHGGTFCSVSQNFWYQIYATMASFYVPLCVMVVVYVKILRVVADKKKQMGWKDKHQTVHRTSSSTTNNSNSTTVTNNSNSATKALLTSTATSSCSFMGSTKKNVNGTSGPGLFFPATTLHRFKKEKLLGGLKEHKASTTLGIIMSAFVICWLPFFVLALVRPFLALNNLEIPGWVSSLFNWLGYANSALNPVIYATLNRDFRKPFKEILCFRCSTLDTLMRREFYNQQYGDDKENLRRASRHVPSVSNNRPPGEEPETPINL